MKVERVNQQLYVEPVKNVKPKAFENESTKKDKSWDEAVKYEASENTAPATYTKSGHVYDKETVEKLKKQSQEQYNYLRGLVEKLLLKQGHSIKTITSEEWDDIKIDEETKLEAQKMLEPGGPLSSEAVSDRLVDFAKAISGGDIEKLDKLREAIEEGFKQAEELLGKLPEISKTTYRLTMEKLDQWAQGAKASNS